MAFAHVGLDYRNHVEVDAALLRPAEVHHLRGDYSKARQKLGWNPVVSFEKLVEMMVDSDVALVGKSSASVTTAGAGPVHIGRLG